MKENQEFKDLRHSGRKRGSDGGMKKGERGGRKEGRKEGMKKWRKSGFDDITKLLNVFLYQNFLNSEFCSLELQLF